MARKSDEGSDVRQRAVDEELRRAFARVSAEPVPAKLERLAEDLDARLADKSERPVKINGAKNSVSPPAAAKSSGS